MESKAGFLWWLTWLSGRFSYSKRKHILWNLCFPSFTGKWGITICARDRWQKGSHLHRSADLVGGFFGDEQNKMIKNCRVCSMDESESMLSKNAARIWETWFFWTWCHWWLWFLDESGSFSSLFSLHSNQTKSPGSWEWTSAVRGVTERWQTTVFLDSQGGRCVDYWLSLSSLIFHIGVSKNRGTQKWMVYNGKPY